MTSASSEDDGLKFGTSGLRGPAHLLDGPAAGRWTRAFLDVLSARGDLPSGAPVFVARDRRDSSPSIAARVIGAINRAGFRAMDCGAVSTPALALASLAARAPAIMVTGSHIPADRNGLKFYRPDGEIDKTDEAAIGDAWKTADDDGAPDSGTAAGEAGAAYVQRITDFFAPGSLEGIRVGVWRHTSVATPLIESALAALGAEITPVGDSDVFVALDTEALGTAETAMLRDLVHALKLDALVSTDPDGDRPLVVDEAGQVVAGDLLGAAAAAELGIRRIVTPVSSNSGLREGAQFDLVRRTRIGSPYVLSALAEEAQTPGPLAGFEANGGFILASEVERDGRRLSPLPTRDSLLPIAGILVASRSLGLAALTARFGFRAKRSTRIEHVPTAASRELVAEFQKQAGRGNIDGLGAVQSVDVTDGLRLTLDNGRIVHFRPSGNAPELRIYVEATDDDAALALENEAIAAARHVLKQGAHA